MAYVQNPYAPYPQAIPPPRPPAGPTAAPWPAHDPRMLESHDPLNHAGAVSLPTCATRITLEATMASAFAALFLHLTKTRSGNCNVILHAGRRPWVGSPPGRPIKRQRANFAGPVPECVHINKRITAAQSAEVRQYLVGHPMGTTV